MSILETVEDDVAAFTAKFLPASLQAIVVLAVTDEGKILQGLVTTAAQDVITDGLTTASFTQAAKNVISQLVSQNIALGEQIVYTFLNAAVASTVPSTVTLTSTADTAPVAADTVSGG
jgi:hypothetical protein